MKDEKNNHHKLKKFIKIFTILLFITLIIYLYARYIETKGLITKEYKIVNENFKYDFYGLKIIHLSDIHYGETTNSKDLENIVNEINLINPDIVVFTGDLYSKTLDNEQKQELINNLKNIKFKLGKYAVSGNCDDENFDAIIKEANFINLNNDYDIIYNSNNNNSILIAGINTEDDISDSFEKINNYISNNDALENITEENNKQNIIYKILLLHKPDKILDFDYSKYDLILAGHSHNGQIRLPIIGAIVTPDGAKKYYKEYYKLENTEFFISSGIGTSDIKLRLFNKPSINLYRLSDN